MNDNLKEALERLRATLVRADKMIEAAKPLKEDLIKRLK